MQTANPTSLIRLDKPDDSCVGGFAIAFPSGACKALSWKSQAPIPDSMAAAKHYASEALQTCLREGRMDDAERTNWASVTAAVQRIIQDWNEIRRTDLYGPAGQQAASPKVQ
jgi:hypothetical protein